jgi:hypothetical protein
MSLLWHTETTVVETTGVTSTSENGLPTFNNFNLSDESMWSKTNLQAID